MKIVKNGMKLAETNAQLYVIMNLGQDNILTKNNMFPEQYVCIQTTEHDAKNQL